MRGELAGGRLDRLALEAMDELSHRPAADLFAADVDARRAGVEHREAFVFVVAGDDAQIALRANAVLV